VLSCILTKIEAGPRSCWRHDALEACRAAQAQLRWLRASQVWTLLCPGPRLRT
jgi:hypothetical protein